MSDIIIDNHLAVDENTIVIEDGGQIDAQVKLDAIAAKDAAAVSAAAALVSETNAAASEIITNADAAQTQLDAANTASDVAQTALDVIATNADVVATSADAASTAADVVTTNADVLLTNADVVITNADVLLTNADVVSSGNNATAAQTAETNAQLRAWESEAEAMTANSYAVEAVDVFANVYTSDGDGTFTATPSTDYSSLHHAIKAAGFSTGTSIELAVKATEPIAAGAPVAFVGFNSGDDSIEVENADQALNIAIGVTRNPISTGQSGTIVSHGTLEGFDTSSWLDGAILYVDGAGSFTSTKPVTGYAQPIGYVLKSRPTNGAIMITVDYPNQIASDVRVTAAGNIVSTDVQSALEEIDVEVSANTTKLAGIEDGATADQTLADLGITATATEVNYTTDVTSNIQAQIDTKAPLASPALTGTPTAPTATVGTNTTQLATTAFIQSQLNNVVEW